MRLADLLRRHGDVILAWADLRQARARQGGAAEGRFVEAELARDLGWLHLGRRTIEAHLVAQPGDGNGHVLHGELLAMTSPLEVQTALVSPGDTWSYLDDGSDQRDPWVSSTAPGRLAPRPWAMVLTGT